MKWEELTAVLSAPLDRSLIKQRTQGGRTFSYIEGYTAINQANKIFGFGGWGYQVTELNIVASAGEPKYVYAFVEVRALDAPPRRDVGFAAVNSARVEALDMAIKGAVTDGLKRALRSFGPQFANDLYEKDDPQEAPQTSDAAGVSPEGGEYICADCGAPITAWTAADGTHFSAGQLAAARTRRFGRPLCGKCASNAKR
jgi:DNA recombination protein Rad52